MIDIKLIRENRDLVKENIKKKFQDEKLPLVDEIFELDKRVREVQVRADGLKADKNRLSGEIGKLMKDGKKDEAAKIKEEIAKMAGEITELEVEQETLAKDIKDKMMVIPQIVHETVPVGKDDSENVEVGDVLVKLANVVQSTNGSVNSGVPEINNPNSCLPKINIKTAMIRQLIIATFIPLLYLCKFLLSHCMVLFFLWQDQLFSLSSQEVVFLLNHFYLCQLNLYTQQQGLLSYHNLVLHHFEYHEI